MDVTDSTGESDDDLDESQLEEIDYWVAECLRHEGRHEYVEALDAIEKALAINPHSAFLWTGKCCCPARLRAV